MSSKLFWAVLLMCGLPCLSASASNGESSGSWVSRLTREVERIDAETPGNLGLHIKRLRDGSELSYQSARSWYLASTVKVPIAIAALQLQQEGRISLDQTMVLRKSDYVDGSGALLWKDPGAVVSVRELIEYMLTQSDSTATDLLIRRIGIEELNRRVSKMAPGGFGPITPLLQVRHDAYGELHPRARELSNMDFLEFKKLKGPLQKLSLFASRLKLRPEDLRHKTLEDAFEKYYEKGLNSASLESYSLLLEKLESRKLLNSENTRWILTLMEKMKTGEKRIKAGLPLQIRFAQKTGTQLRRLCNMGIARKKNADRSAVVISACLEKFEDQKEAELALKKLGAALSRSSLF